MSCNLKANTHKIRHKNSWKARKHHKLLFVVFIDMGPRAAEGGWRLPGLMGKLKGNNNFNLKTLAINIASNIG